MTVHPSCLAASVICSSTSWVALTLPVSVTTDFTASGNRFCDVVERTDRDLVGLVGHGLHREVGVAALDAHHVGRDLRKEARQAVALAGVVVEDVAVADEEEVGRARLLDLRVEVEERGVVLVELDLAPVDSARGVAPRHEHVAGIEDLLVETAPAGESGVGARRNVDGSPR